MKLRLTPSLLAIGLATLAALPLSTVQARTWTSSADSTRKFEARYVKCEDDVVTVKLKSGTPLSFPLSSVSEADKAFVRSRLALKPKTVPKDPDAPMLDLPRLFHDKLITVDATGKVKPFAYEKGKVPDLFLLYISAYW